MKFVQFIHLIQFIFMCSLFFLRLPPHFIRRWWLVQHMMAVTDVPSSCLLRWIWTWLNLPFNSYKKAPDAFLGLAKQSKALTLRHWFWLWLSFAKEKKPMRTIFHTSESCEPASDGNEANTIQKRQRQSCCCLPSSRQIWMRTVCISTLKMFYLIIVIGRLRVHEKRTTERVGGIRNWSDTFCRPGKDWGCRERRKHLIKWTETAAGKEWMKAPIQVYVNWTHIFISMHIDVYLFGDVS